MPRNELNEMSVIGFDAPTMGALADKIQDFLEEQRANHHITFMDRQYNTPQYNGGSYTALMYYTLSELPKEADTPEEDKHLETTGGSDAPADGADADKLPEAGDADKLPEAGDADEDQGEDRPE